MPFTKAEKAQQFRQQHLDARLIILPNIWDAMGAKLMEVLGFPSVATASVSVAISNGYRDGEHIPFESLLNLVKNICDRVTIPVTVDMERGFAAGLQQLKENIHQLIEHGGIGINLEDSDENENMLGIADQCRRIEAVREQASLCGVPLVINARTDVFMFKKETPVLEKAIERALAYKAAGADCIYPITIPTYDAIARFVEAVQMPVNVNLHKSIPDLKKLEELGVARVSVGPQLLNHVLVTMKQIADDLKNYHSDGFFGRELLSRDFMNKLVSNP